MAHRCLHLRLGTLPRWLNEGLAESLADGSGTPEHAAGKRSLRLRTVEGDWMRLEELFEVERTGFVRRPDVYYFQSWVLVDSLLNGNEPSRAFFARAWNLLEESVDPGTALARALEEFDLHALETAFVAHFRGLQGR